MLKSAVIVILIVICIRTRTSINKVCSRVYDNPASSAAADLNHVETSSLRCLEEGCELKFFVYLFTHISITFSSNFIYLKMINSLVLIIDYIQNCLLVLYINYLYIAR